MSESTVRAHTAAPHVRPTIAAKHVDRFVSQLFTVGVMLIAAAALPLSGAATVAVAYRMRHPQIT
jgi:hypothetical protein